MKRLKNETLSIRTSPEIKDLLRLAAERERRSAASMIESLILEYAREHGITCCRPLRAKRGRREQEGPVRAGHLYQVHHPGP